ncbi:MULTISPECIES: hypothetical protein [unclassified Streptomyces]|uniref:hypothetical protein n=1 Tax=unclassified Streptomyces TaxID=2593676 RepID=UPI0033BD4C63
MGSGRTKTIGAAVVAALALLTGCSGDDGDGGAAPKGLSAAEVCGGFAREAPVATALGTVVGGGRFEDDLSKPDEALAGLRDAAAAPRAGTYRPQPVRYCGLRPAGGGTEGLAIEVTAVGKGPYLGPELAPSVTSYHSGIEAFSSSGLAKLYFSCRLPAPARAIVVQTSVRGPAGVPDADPEQPTRLITLANAAARHVSAELGCAGDGLVKGVPAEAKG